MVFSKPGSAPKASLPPPMWGLHALLWVTLLTCLSAGRTRVCGREAIRILQNITKLLGDTVDGMLYTPEDITVCTVENLNCFHTELRVIWWEHREHIESLSLLIRHLSLLEKRKLEAKSCQTAQPCHPCESHQEQPVPQFLSKLLEQLQWECWIQGSNVPSCPSWPG
ncbi:interleukin-15-like [Carettochelys insculpta]|uniref:interleukin-15-like n=1 Tax=Carettochelys insculpta TaxID=44489 RepID=UPI003EBAA323